MHRYRVTKVWYDETEIVESEEPLEDYRIRPLITESRSYCDEYIVEEVSEDEA